MKSGKVGSTEGKGQETSVQEREQAGKQLTPSRVYQGYPQQQKTDCWLSGARGQKGWGSNSPGLQGFLWG